MKKVQIITIVTRAFSSVKKEVEKGISKLKKI